MRFTPVSVLRRYVAVFIAVIFGPYLIRHLFIGLAIKAVSNFAGANGNDFVVGTVEKFVSRPVRLSCGKVAKNKKLSHVGVLSGFAELSCCCCCTSLFCLDSKVGGAFLTTSEASNFIEGTRPVTPIS